jgi:hypothetical protein
MKPVSWAIAVNVNIASPGVTIDGVSPATGERVLLLAQTTTSQNGIYVYNGSAVAMTRSTDAALSTDWKQGSFIPITKGRAGLAGKMARYTNSDNPTIGTTALTFAFQGDYSTVTALPLGIADGQECYYLASDTNGVVWHLKYRSGSASSYKWEYVGGPPLSVESAGAQTSSSSAGDHWVQRSVDHPAARRGLYGRVRRAGAEPGRQRLSDLGEQRGVRQHAGHDVGELEHDQVPHRLRQAPHERLHRRRAEARHRHPASQHRPSFPTAAAWP